MTYRTWSIFTWVLIGLVIVELSKLQDLQRPQRPQSPRRVAMTTMIEHTWLLDLVHQQTFYPFNALFDYRVLHSASCVALCRAAVQLTGARLCLSRAHVFQAAPTNSKELLLLCYQPGLCCALALRGEMTVTQRVKTVQVPPGTLVLRPERVHAELFAVIWFFSLVDE